MKLDNVEVNGFDHVVLTYTNTVFKKRDDGRWAREGAKVPDIIDHEDMVMKIKKFTYSPWHRVCINGTYVNINPWDMKV